MQLPEVVNHVSSMGHLQCRHCSNESSSSCAPCASAADVSIDLQAASSALWALHGEPEVSCVEDQSQSGIDATLEEDEGLKVGLNGMAVSSTSMLRQRSYCANDTSMGMMPFFPMYVTPTKTVLEWDSLVAHETALREGMIRVSQPEDVVVFWSHEWLGRDHPDPENAHLRCMQGLLQRIAGGGSSAASMFSASKHTVAASDVSQQLGVTEDQLAMSLDHSVHWMDYFSVPQDGSSHSEQRSAILSIAAYASLSHLMMVLCPPKIHSDTKQQCDLASWQRRGWCRLELLAMTWTHEGCPVVVCSSPDQIRFATELSLKKMDARGAPGNGDLTCCEMGHFRNGEQWPCDKAYFREIIDKLHRMRVKTMWMRDGVSLQWRWAVAMGPIVAAGVDDSFGRAKSIKGQSSNSGLDKFLDEYRLGVDELDEAGNTVLHWASFVGNLQCTQQLVSDARGTQLVNCTNRGDMHAGIHQYSLLAGGGVTALMLAAERGFADVLQVLINARSNVNLAATYGATALNLAATRGNVVCVDILLNHNADLDAQLNEESVFFGPNCIGFCPLHAAAIGGWFEVVQRLLDGRADPDSRSRFGATPLHCAVAVKDNAGIVQLLLDADANPMCRYSESYPVTAWRAQTAEDIANEKGFLQSSIKLAHASQTMRNSWEPMLKHL